MSLHMLCLPVDPRALMRLGRDHRLLTDSWSVEMGYLVHALFASFGTRLQPFDIQDNANQNLHVLAYTNEPGAVFERGAQASRAVDWQAARTKAMPSLFAGQRLGFRVRVCPVVRVGKHHKRFTHGAEVDAYVNEVESHLAEQEQACPGIEPRDLKAAIVRELPPRAEIYRSWLAARLEPAASLEMARLISTRDALLWRRGIPQGGPALSMYDRPRLSHAGRSALGRREAVFEGTLRVGDPAAFASLLARGVGRHRAFGFGMLLLLRQPDPAC